MDAFPRSKSLNRHLNHVILSLHSKRIGPSRKKVAHHNVLIKDAMQPLTTPSLDRISLSIAAMVGTYFPNMFASASAIKIPIR